MTERQREIIARLVRAMEQDAPEWALPWETDKNKIHDVKRIESIDRVLEAYYNHEHIVFAEQEQGQSYYAPDRDIIIVPLKRQFKSADAYYATKAHETIHSTGDYTRCNRATFSEYTSFRFGDSRYSREELTAEIGACFLLDALGADISCAEHNAIAYIHNWLDKLNHNTKWIYKAGELASEAVDYILESAGER